MTSVFSSYVSLTASGVLKETNKAKGIPKAGLYTMNDEAEETPFKFSNDVFEEEEPKEICFNSLKKIHKTVMNPDKAQGITPFTIKAVKNTRTFLKTTYKGLDLKENGLFYPFGYEPKIKIQLHCF